MSYSADAEYQVLWSRHLLARMRAINGAELLIGSEPVAHKPHFSIFVSESPFSGDLWLGAVLRLGCKIGPLPQPLSTFHPGPLCAHSTPAQRLWHAAANPNPPVWGLIQKRASPAFKFLIDPAATRRLGARPSLASLNPKSGKVHEHAPAGQMPTGTCALLQAQLWKN